MAKDKGTVQFVVRSDPYLIRQLDILSCRAKYADPNESKRTLRSRNYLINMVLKEFVSKQIGKDGFWLPVQIEEMEDRIKERLLKEFSRLEAELVEYYRKQPSQIEGSKKDALAENTHECCDPRNPCDH